MYNVKNKSPQGIALMGTILMINMNVVWIFSLISLGIYLMNIHIFLISILTVLLGIALIAAGIINIVVSVLHVITGKMIITSLCFSIIISIIGMIWAFIVCSWVVALIFTIITWEGVGMIVYDYFLGQ